jgi:endo-1,4-beta-xylanase
MSKLLFAITALLATAAAQPLRDLAAQRGIHIGSAAAPGYFGETSYFSTLGAEFNQLEPENDMKFQPIHPSPGNLPSSYNFTNADALVSYAKNHNMAVRGHTLVWYQQNPTWLTNGGYTSSQLADILQGHISTVVGRYAGRVYAWDVVNEAFNDDGTIRSTIWSNSPGIGLSGTAYIEQALRWAHAADPQALLFYNDYSNASINAKSDAIYKMAQDFIARGVPLHGIGLQMHLTNANTDLSNIEPNIQRLTALGLQVQYTELDVRLPVDSSGSATPAMLATEAQIYGQAVAICLKYPLCTAVQTWGFTDKHSWIPGTYPGFGAALEFDSNYQPKPAYTAMRSALMNSPPVIAAAGMANAASYSTDAVAPGEIVTLFGPTFGPAALTIAQPDTTPALPASLAGVRLLFDGVPAPLLYVQVDQVSAVVPFSVAGRTTTAVQYEYQGIGSNTVTLKAAPTAPGIFTLDSSGKGPAAILDAAYRVVSASNPVHVGDVIQVFATGAGTTVPASVDGAIAVSPPFPAPVTAVTATIGGVTCPVLYAGGASGLVAGALQVNVQIAAGVPAGEPSIVVSVGGVSSRSDATVSVR